MEDLKDNIEDMKLEARKNFKDSKLPLFKLRLLKNKLNFQQKRMLDSFPSFKTNKHNEVLLEIKKRISDLRLKK